MASSSHHVCEHKSYHRTHIITLRHTRTRFLALEPRFGHCFSRVPVGRNMPTPLLLLCRLPSGIRPIAHRAARSFTRSLIPRVDHRRPLYFVDLTNLPFMFLTPYRPNKQLITHCDRKPSVLTACLLLVRNDGRAGRWRRFGHQSIIDHSLSDRNPYCCFGMVGGEHSDRG